MPCYAFEGLVPVVDPRAYVHPEAILIGDVVIEAECFIGPGAVLRGDLARITVQTGANVQDNCVIHSVPQQETRLAPASHIGHSAVLHGCSVGRGALVGIHAVVMDGAAVGEEAFVGALSFVGPGVQIPPRSLAVGTPARVVRPLSEAEIEQKMEGTRHYQHLARRYAATARPVTPREMLEPDRPRLP